MSSKAGGERLTANVGSLVETGVGSLTNHGRCSDTHEVGSKGVEARDDVIVSWVERHISYRVTGAAQ